MKICKMNSFLDIIVNNFVIYIQYKFIVFYYSFLIYYFLLYVWYFLQFELYISLILVQIQTFSIYALAFIRLLVYIKIIFLCSPNITLTLVRVNWIIPKKFSLVLFLLLFVNIKLNICIFKRILKRSFLVKISSLVVNRLLQTRILVLIIAL